MYPFEERLHYGQYVTARLTRRTPVYDWYAFPHSFSRELVHELLDEFGVDSNSIVFDPFVGAGTTLLACRERGIPAFGIDQLPFAVFTSNVKICNYDPDDLQHTLDRFTPSASSPHVFGSVPIIDRAFSSEVRKRVAAIHSWTQSLREKQARFFLLALLYILESVSQTAKSGGWLRFVENEVDPDSVEELFKARARKMIDDIRGLDMPHNRGLWYAMPGDARCKSSSHRRAQYVISSPPYLNRHDYTRVFALEMALHFVKTNRELISLRTNALRSHVEAKSQTKLTHNGYQAPERLKTLATKIESESKERDKKRIPSMVRGYFEDIYMTLASLYERIGRGGKIAFVLGNVRFSGMMIPVDEIVAEIGEQAGFETDKIVVARYRGNSAQQMARFGRDPSRESIIVWHKVS
ncbi:MAG: hypothetical protein E3J21_03585 [Anaerolineales bacterium]|nr:MAG: hypothetical protein E3J21_03585 [Anaerolineales bacterium]